jgi:hypothetical protein
VPPNSSIRLSTMALPRRPLSVKIMELLRFSTRPCAFSRSSGRKYATERRFLYLTNSTGQRIEVWNPLSGSRDRVWPNQFC